VKPQEMSFFSPSVCNMLHLNYKKWSCTYTRDCYFICVGDFLRCTVYSLDYLSGFLISPKVTEKYIKVDFSNLSVLHFAHRLPHLLDKMKSWDVEQNLKIHFTDFFSFLLILFSFTVPYKKPRKQSCQPV